MKVVNGQTWVLGDEEGGETVATVLDIGVEVARVLVLSSTLPGVMPGSQDLFSLSWFNRYGSLLSESRVR